MMYHQQRLNLRLRMQLRRRLMLTTVLLEQVESRVVEWLLMQLTKGTLEGGPKRGIRKHSDIGRLAGAL